METATPFDLNRAIQRWRDNLAQSPAFRGENLDELEAHLRDSIGALESRGLSASEAFQIATQRLGGTGRLEAEFRKVNNRSIWLDRLFWMLVGIEVWSLISGLVFSLARTSNAFGWTKLDYDWRTHGLALPVTLWTVSQLLAFAASIALCWWLVVRKGGNILARLNPWLRRRSGFTAVCAPFSLAAIFIQIFSGSLSALLFWKFGSTKVSETMMYSSYSQFWVLPVQTTVLIASILVLARKRLGIAKP